MHDRGRQEVEISMGLAFKYELELLGRPLARMELGALHVMGVGCLIAYLVRLILFVPPPCVSWSLATRCIHCRSLLKSQRVKHWAE